MDKQIRTEKMVGENKVASAEVAREVRGRVNLDKIFVEEIGQLGRYQQRMLALSTIFVIFVAWSASEYVFTTGRISTRCLIPECETQESAVFSPSWLENAVPAAGSSFDNCRRFSPVNSTGAGDCPVEWFDQDQTEDCEKYVYEDTNTVVYDFGLACDEWRRALIGSVRTAGSLVALPLTGYISDRWGRRTALCINAINNFWMGALRYFAGTYVGFLVSELMESICGSAAFSCAYILIMELVGPDYRVAAGAAVKTFFSMGQVTLAAMAWAVPNWRNLTLALYLPQIISLAYFWVTSESIRWYLSKGKYDEAENILKKVARVNRKDLSQKSLDMIREAAEEEKKEKIMKKQQNIKEPWLVVTVIRNRAILRRVLISPVWIASTFIYYGMSINAVNLSQNRYLNYMAVSAVEIPGFLTPVFLMGRIGRRPVLIGAFWMCCACQIAYLFMPDGQYGVALAVYLVGKYSIAIVMTAVHVYTVELYPTSHRHSLFAFSSTIGRFGSILAPLTPAFGDQLPFILFACFAFLASLLVFITPETLGTKLPDTMEEAVMAGRKRS